MGNFEFQIFTNIHLNSEVQSKDFGSTAGYGQYVLVLPLSNFGFHCQLTRGTEKGQFSFKENVSVFSRNSTQL